MSQVEVAVVIPEERVPEFYSLIGRWLQGETPFLESVSPRRRRRAPYQNVGRRSSSRYSKFAEFLQDKPDSYVVSFAEIEEALGGELPASARKHRAWWANTERNTQARAWAESGYVVVEVDLDQEQVTFERDKRLAAA